MSDADLSVSGSSGREECDMLFVVVEAPGIPTSLTEGKEWALLLCVAKWVTV